MTPLDFGPQKNVEIMKENLHNYGWNVLSAWAMGDTLETLQQAETADVNLVVSAVGLRAAKVLQEKFGTPYVIGTPNEWLAETISEALEEAAKTTNGAIIRCEIHGHSIRDTGNTKMRQHREYEAGIRKI